MRSDDGIGAPPATARSLGELVTAAIAAIPTVAAIPAVSTVAAAAAAAATSALPGRTFLARARDVDRQRTALEFLVMEHFHGLVRLVRGGHFDEGEAAGFAGELVEHDVHGCDNAGLGEIILQVVVHGLVGEVSYEETGLIHDTKVIGRLKTKWGVAALAVSLICLLVLAGGQSVFLTPTPLFFFALTGP